MKLRYYRWKLRFLRTHKKIGCVKYLGMSIMGEPMYICHLHNKVW